MAEKEWFAEWFDTPYYHMLYKNRDDSEAALFIGNLIGFLKPNKDDLFADLGCGKGRHSVFLNNLGFRVCGYDLSSNSINEAKKWENDTLNFYIHDMRQPIASNRFNYIFNLFTSFGYFKNQSENLKVLKNIYRALKPGGYLVIDFFNSDFVMSNYQSCEETKEIENLRFKINKKIEDGFIVKTIDILEKGLHFEERVQLITREQFTELFNKAGFNLYAQFGDYELNPVSEKSPRLISIVTKA